ncbi:MAG: recombination mediator RecR [Candidatus Marinimicrobia bacterium]|jgi:recombination protein RecR|nr:recombination protein RecR [Candidatus Neomarinimicrobiota bacterium]MDP6499287.1 recombination mediator RecR [Candidatus Neomarinimicrobiota bacterium]MDP6726283.1 recombination mediator RecR [Candidatus Neomarinimicrobiota bacterium]|tara:strand:+ start:2279 stop:2872 length:594 start_codon:yes stop_codon:yes gene_type:complete
MSFVPPPVEKLIEAFARFPGIGKKTAQRMAFYVLKSDNQYAVQLAEAVMDVKSKILTCSMCGGITVEDPCSICSDSKRQDDLLCIVEESSDIYAFEKTNSFRGKYHVLGGVLSPLDGIGPDDLTIDNLMSRVTNGMEVILATNPSVEGEATALYIGKLLKEMGIKSSRLARGIPVGGALEYIDEATLIRAIEGRVSL